MSAETLSAVAYIMAWTIISGAACVGVAGIVTVVSDRMRRLKP